MKISAAIIVTAIMCVCLIVAQDSERKPKLLTHSEALNLAVKLANQKCQELYDAAPFDSILYLIEFKNSSTGIPRKDDFLDNL